MIKVVEEMDPEDAAIIIQGAAAMSDTGGCPALCR